MAAVNARRVWLGALLGGVVWTVWSILIEMGALGEARYAAAQQAGLLLTDPRYPYFLPVWILALFVAAYVLAWVYASVRATRGPGPKTALIVGALVGFVAGFPLNFATASWSSLDRVFPFWWTIEMWGGAILAGLAAGWIYRE